LTYKRNFPIFPLSESNVLSRKYQKSDHVSITRAKPEKAAEPETGADKEFCGCFGDDER
jgi:hypothetical protein